MHNESHTHVDSGRSPAPVTLATALNDVPGIGAYRAERFAKLEVHTVADLLKHLPHRYEHHLPRTPIGQLRVGTIGTTCGMIAQCRWISGRGGFTGRRRGGSGRFTAAMQDDTGRLDLVWFNAHYLADRLHPGMTILVTGKVDVYADHRQMVNPKWQLIDLPASARDDAMDAIAPMQERHRPIYPATEELPTAQIEKIVADLLPAALPQIDDHFDAAYRERRGLPELRTAYQWLHAPLDDQQVASARRRLAYDELLLLQLGFALKRKQTQLELRAPALRYSPAIDQHIRQRFPFTLTASQQQVIQQIAADLQRDKPMNRLLQGDVGSGKTVVALYALLMAVASNKQGAIMAPTELLAEQHFLSLSDMLDGSTVKLGLITGSQTRGERAALLREVEAGRIDILVGTQALLTESVQFADLAVVVIDEQHRFGVMQRAAIRAKVGDEQTVPHTLVMTATPIPRTLSLTVFGDLDVSTINELPPGRQPIITRVVGPEKSHDVYTYIAKRVAEGEQAYIVVPTVEQGELDLANVTEHAAMLQRDYFAGRQVATLHGQLKQQTRAGKMHRFRQGKIDVLVATTVIEVGVDVPNASLMVVEHAERFGLAQLHQLRGRVGRGNRKSLCVFIADPTTEDAAARIEAIGKTCDGFAIAEADLAIRGMGEFFGTRQSGLPPLKVARIPDHLELLQLAKRDAIALIDADPKLTAPEHRLLRARLYKTYGEALGLADVG